MKKRKWTEENLFRSAAQVKSKRQLLSCLGLKEAGGNYAQLHKYLAQYSVDISHFTGRGWSKGLRGIGKPRLSLKDILVKKSTFQSYKLKKRLIAAGIKNGACEECGWAKMSPDGRTPLELDHINGDSMDNRLDNLRVLCPNCHSLKPTHRGRNRRKK
ncbi:MAG: HNH endonuclease signature motif containing protein [Patescibacteria group bacterium]